MKPMIIIPDGNQKTITMSIEEFKKLIGDVWEEGYKEGQAMEKTNSYPLPHFHYKTEGSSCSCSDHSEAKTVDNFINKRTYDEGSSNFKTNIW